MTKITQTNSLPLVSLEECDNLSLPVPLLAPLCKIHIKCIG